MNAKSSSAYVHTLNRTRRYRHEDTEVFVLFHDHFQVLLQLLQIVIRRLLVTEYACAHASER